MSQMRELKLIGPISLQIMELMWLYLLSINLDNIKTAAYIGMLPSGFEPESQTREAWMIGHYTTGAVGEEMRMSLPI